MKQVVAGAHEQSATLQALAVDYAADPKIATYLSDAAKNIDHFATSAVLGNLTAGTAFGQAATMQIRMAKQAIKATTVPDC